MTKQAIREMIEYYGMSRWDNGIRISKHKDEASKNIEALKAAKAEIIAYWDAEAEAENVEWNRRWETFLSIPGVREIKEAQKAWDDYYYEFDRAMEEGNGRVVATPKVSIKELVAQHPDGAFAMKIYGEIGSMNNEIRTIVMRAYNALLDGEAVPKVREAYEAEMDKFVERHQWD